VKSTQSASTYLLIMLAAKTLTFLAIAILLPSVSVHASEKIAKESFVWQGKKHTYYLFVPPDLGPTAAVPMILMFHGSGGNGLSIVEKWADLAAKEGVILVGPDAQNYERWGGTQDGADFLHGLVETIKTKYPVNPRRIYLFGHSAGAVFALTFSMLESGYFAAVAVHAGAWRNEKEFQVVDYANRKVPLAIFVGDSDPFFSLASVKATNDALRARGFPIEVTIIKGHNHSYDNLAPEINRLAWEFLKQRELAEDPKYSEYSSPKAANDINNVIGEINELTGKANELLQRFDAKEEELKKIDYVKERDSVMRVAREEVSLLTESGAAHREAVLIAERLTKMNLKGIYPQYFSLIAQLERKRTESVETMREYAELLLSGQPHNTITIKRNEAVLKAERLQQEADELEQKAARLRAAQD
jgi:predicted esterase